MGKLGVVGLAFALAAVCVPEVAARSSGGPSRTSGGSFPGERDCTACHVGSEANSGPGTLSLTVGGAAAPAAADAPALTYTPGAVIPLIVSFEDTTKFRVGFQLTARSGDGCGQPGSLAAASSDDGSGIKSESGTCGPAATQVQWVTHSAPRNGSSATFAIDWTAPAEAMGPVTIAVAVNGADGDRGARNDSVYTLQAVLQPGSVTPVISDNGVSSLGAPDPANSSGAPGAIAVISGTGFAGTGEQSAGSLGADGRLATKVGGICVEVNQVRAPVLNVDPTNVFIQIPFETASGNAAVQVIKNCDPAPGDAQALSSNTVQFLIGSVQPVLLGLSESIAGASAVHQDFSLVANEPEAAPATETEMSTMSMSADPDMSEDESGPAISPAVHGEVVTFFGTGFGTTDPALATGEIPAFSHVLASEAVNLMFGQTVVQSQDIMYVGATPGVAGLYQVSARIGDAMPVGEHAVSWTVDSQSSLPGPLIAIAMADTAVACVADLVLGVGESCSGTLNVFGTEYTGVLRVEETQACVEVPGLPPFCSLEADTLNPLGLGLLIVSKQSDGTWKITKFGD